MTATFREAQDDILSLVTNVAKAREIPIFFEAVAGELPTEDVVHALVEIRHLDGGQGSLAGASGRRRWRREGVLWIKIRGPIGGGLGGLYDVGQKFVNAIESAATEHCVWFRGVHLREAGPSGVWYQINVLANFTYDEVR